MENDPVIVRSRDAGAFCGQLVETDLSQAAVTLREARRLWYWAGAATLSELATEGTAKPKECKFPAPTEGDHVILGVCEIISVTERALASIQGVPAWKES
jgi:hypothetical protein